MTNIKLFLLACVGAIGTLMSYSVFVFFSSRCPSFPCATLFVNMSGALVAGFLREMFFLVPVSYSMKIIVTVGLLGAFTTYSAFVWEVVALVRDGFIMRGLGYMFFTNIAGVILICVGIFIARLIFAQ
ncbi:MAG: CrcB family protein [bacterium]